MNLTRTILKTLCCEYGGPPIVQSPYRLPGQETVAVTDGRILLLVGGLSVDVPTADDVIAQKILAVAGVQGFHHSLSVEAMKAFVGTYHASGPCNECDGTGEVKCRHCCRPGAECEACGGDGMGDEPVHYGVLFGKAVDRNRLAKFLQHLDSDGTVGVHVQAEKDKPLYVCGAVGRLEWTLAVMPCNVPAFELEAVPKLGADQPVARLPHTRIPPDH